jgi:uncharacterized protein with GYD domain
MQTFICSFCWTDGGIKELQRTPHRRASAWKHAELLGIAIKNIYFTLGETDLLYIVEAPDAESVAKFALLVSSSGNVRTRTVRAYTTSEFDTMLEELAKLPSD